MLMLTKPDKSPNQILKECAKELAPADMCLFQRSIDSGAYFDDWTNAYVSPILDSFELYVCQSS